MRRGEFKYVFPAKKAEITTILSRYFPPTSQILFLLINPANLLYRLYLTMWIKMVKLKGYEKIIVPQRHRETGCIPTGIEWMIRYKASQTGKWHIPEDELKDFQEKYDLELNGTGSNWFSSIEKEIKKTYPQIPLEIISFDDSGIDKYNHIEGLIKKGTPCIISIKKNRQENAHIVPVVEIDETIVNVIWDADFTEGQKIVSIPRELLINLHDEGVIGKNILILH